jgi:uncharacterized membrane protein
MPKFSCQDGVDDPRFQDAQHGMAVLDHQGNPIGRVQEFDTDTLLAVVKAADYAFFYPEGNVVERDKLLAQLPAEYHSHVCALDYTVGYLLPNEQTSAATLAESEALRQDMDVTFDMLQRGWMKQSEAHRVQVDKLRKTIGALITERDQLRHDIKVLHRCAQSMEPNHVG